MLHRSFARGNRGHAAASERSLGVPARIALATVLLGGVALASIDPFTVLFFVSYGAVGALLAVRRPRNAIGWILLVIAFGFLGVASVPVDVEALRAGTAPFDQVLFTWTSGWSAYASFTGLVALSVTFPKGWFPRGRGRIPAVAVVVAGTACGALAAFEPILAISPGGGVSTVAIRNPFAILPDLPLWTIVNPDSLILPMAFLLAVAVISIVVRYRRSTGILRLQLRWLVAALSLVVIGLLAGLSTSYVFGEDAGALAWIGTIVAFPAVPAAIYVAVMRYRLYEIDRIISRTIAYSLLTAVLGAMYAALVLAFQGLLAGWTRGQTVPVAVSTLIVLALFQPIRNRIRDLVDRRFNRARYDADRIAAGFAERMRDEVDLARLGDAMLGTVAEALAPARSVLWVRGGER